MSLNYEKPRGAKDALKGEKGESKREKLKGEKGEARVIPWREAGPNQPVGKGLKGEKGEERAKSLKGEISPPISSFMGKAGEERAKSRVYGQKDALKGGLSPPTFPMQGETGKAGEERAKSRATTGEARYSQAGPPNHHTDENVASRGTDRHLEVQLFVAAVGKP